MLSVVLYVCGTWSLKGNYRLGMCKNRVPPECLGERGIKQQERLEKVALLRVPKNTTIDHVIRVIKSSKII
jgi:hypothetical protein